jgi:1,4-alpha-glucan branching enzyme
MASSGGGYLNFMGNEFGHPEWIDFPRDGNNWSYKYARRQWQLAENKDLKYHFLSDFDKKMMNINREFNILEAPYVYRIIENTYDKIIVFTRGDFLFVFNFHPTNSYTDYGIPLTGKFKIVLDTDDPDFGGFDRIDRSVIYSSVKKAERYTVNIPFKLFLYLPARTALLFKKERVRRVTEI